jgi:hypothetical protein
MDELTDMIAAGHWTNGPRPLSTYPELGPFIYYIQCGSFIKIGTSINPESRCNQLRRGGKAIRPSLWVEDPRLIAYLPGNVAKERSLHREFAGQRDQGEWFVLTEELIDHVAEAQMQQCLMEVGIHNKQYEEKVAAGEWPALSVDLAAAYRTHLASKDALDPEWAEALTA